jgi:hypothetical protein
MVRFAVRSVAAVLLLALIPVAYYMVGTNQNRVALSLVSVAIVVASLYLMLGPTEHAPSPE